MGHVLGYTVGNDVTMRDYQYKTHQWMQGKAWDGCTPVGPYLVTPDGATHTVWGDSIRPPPESLKQVRIHVAGLKAGTPVRVLFEDRTLKAEDGYFVDDFRGADLYQRYGGGYGVGYGNGPVALHLYEIAGP